MKQTAVEFLIEEIECRGIITKELRIVFEQAKEMEKQQIIDAYVEGGRKGFNEFADDYQQYYKETFNLSQQDKP
jgi:hypothetical protein